MKNINIIVIGCTGLVGNVFIKLLKNIKLDYNVKYFFVASKKSYGRSILFKSIEYDIITLDQIKYNIDESSLNMLINCSSSEISDQLSQNMSSNNILIDNSSRFRLDKNISLVIPEINFPKKIQNIYANPNCSTIILACLLEPLRKFKIKRVVVSTYQAASGAGKKGLDELNLQMKQLVNGAKLTTDYWRKQYVNNVMVHNSQIYDMYNEEEHKMINETKKLFNDEFKITATCIRVPVVKSHCESVNIEFNNNVSYDDIIQSIRKTPYLELLDNKKAHNFPDSLSSTDSTKVYVGHIRPDHSLEKNKGWNFWISGDQLLRGAAYNAFGIMENVFSLL